MVIREFQLTINGTKMFDELVADCGVIFNQGELGENPIFDITDKTIREETIFIFKFENELSTTQIYEEMEKEKCKPGFAEHLFSIIAVNPNLNGTSLVALGAQSIDMDMNDYVLDCKINEKGIPNFGPQVTGKGWGPWSKNDYRYFVGVRC